MFSEFGKYLRTLRINNGELLKDMANNLQVSSAFLSAVETGKKSIPTDWHTKIVSLYKLSNSESKKLQQSIDNSVLSAKLNFTNANSKSIGVALQFARKFNEKSISDKTLDDIMKLLKKDKED